MKILYKEVVVQGIVVDIPDADSLENIEANHRTEIFEAVQEQGWDFTEVLDTSVEEGED